MPSAVKSEIKIAALNEVVAELGEALGNAERNTLGITAARDTHARLVERVAGYRARIDEAFASGLFDLACREPVYAVFRDLVAIVEDSHRGLARAVEEQRPYAQGIRKALALATHRRDHEITRAQRAAELEREDEADASPVLDGVPETGSHDAQGVEPTEHPPSATDAPETASVATGERRTRRPRRAATN